MERLLRELVQTLEQPPGRAPRPMRTARPRPSGRGDWPRPGEPRAGDDPGHPHLRVPAPRPSGRRRPRRPRPRSSPADLADFEIPALQESSRRSSRTPGTASTEGPVDAGPARAPASAAPPRAQGSPRPPTRRAPADPRGRRAAHAAGPPTFDPPRAFPMAGPRGAGSAGPRRPDPPRAKTAPAGPSADDERPARPGAAPAPVRDHDPGPRQPARQCPALQGVRREAVPALQRKLIEGRSTPRRPRAAHSHLSPVGTRAQL
jgi:hypothetical protein